MRILLLADIHMGAIKDMHYIKSIWNEIIMKEIVKNRTDVCVILGDYFDRLFNTNEVNIQLPIECMTDLVRACGKKTKIRIVYGTESHEMNQYLLFSNLMKLCDIRIIRHITEEVINNKSILYIPEEYVNSKHSYYQDTLFAKHYDYVFGHGVIAEGMKSNTPTIKAKNKEKHIPVFTTGDFQDTNITIFGHYHVHTDMGNVHYLGSLFRWQFGEEEPKGYGIIEDDEFHFIENPNAYVYKTYEFDNEDEETIMKKINRIKHDNPELFTDTFQGKVRFIFHSDESSLYENIRTAMLRDKQISTVLKPCSETHIETEEDTTDVFEFVSDKDMDPVNKIQQFISKNDGYDITIESLKKYLYEEINIMGP